MNNIYYADCYLNNGKHYRIMANAINETIAIVNIKFYLLQRGISSDEIIKIKVQLIRSD